MNSGSGEVKKDKSFDVRAYCFLSFMTNKEGMEKNGADTQDVDVPGFCFL